MPDDTLTVYSHRKLEKNKPYRDLIPEELDLLFALYEKYNGVVTHMQLDPNVQGPFKNRNALYYYRDRYSLRKRLAKERVKRVKRVVNKLVDAKLQAVEAAIRTLDTRPQFVYNKAGFQMFDADGAPLIIDRLPYYKEIYTAWKIIKTELGEPSNISASDLTSGGKPLGQTELIVVDFRKGQTIPDETTIQQALPPASNK
jgi:hypothetical protein